MRVYDNGCGATVTVLRTEVEAFKRRWPGSGLPSRAITFAFDNNGNLVDLTPYEVDGEAAIALAQDAQNEAARRLKRPTLARP